jgi:radical SAM superfamily enzyme YgiQ (UPF0313 family)
MNIVFACVHIQPSSRAVPLGAASVAANITKHFPHAVSAAIADCYLNESLEQQLKKILAGKPDCVGLSIYLWNREVSLAIADGVKKALPECIIMVGGPEPTARPEFYQQKNSVDYVFVGEAEEQIIPVIAHLLEKASGIASEKTLLQQEKDLQKLENTLLQAEKIQDSSRLPVPRTQPDLGNLPSPYLDGIIDLSRYDGGALWELSRGCPFKCAFCFESRGDTSIRRFPETRILAELELFQQAGIKELFILDPTFNYNRKQAKKLLRRLAETAPDIHYSMEIRAEFLDEELCYLFSNISCTLQIGLQSIHPEVLKKINRTFRQQVFTEKVFLLHQVGTAYGLDLIYGLPGDSLSGFLESLDYAFSLVPNHLDIFPLAVLPGTELFYLAESYNLHYAPADSWVVTATPEFSPSDLKTAGEVAAAVDLYYNQGMAAAWFDIILPALAMKPSEFFISTAAHTGKVSANELWREDADPWIFQLETTAQAFHRQGIAEYIPLANDLITYFWKTSNLAAVEEGYGSDYVRANRTIALAEFTYDILAVIDLCSQGITQFSDILDICKPEKTCLVFYLIEDEFATYYASGEEYAFLQALIDGDTLQACQFAENPVNGEVIQNLIASGVLEEGEEGA